MFEKADKNGDGKLTQSEWMEVLQQSGVRVTQSVYVTKIHFCKHLVVGRMLTCSSRPWTETSMGD